MSFYLSYSVQGEFDHLHLETDGAGLRVVDATTGETRIPADGEAGPADEVLAAFTALKARDGVLGIATLDYTEAEIEERKDELVCAHLEGRGIADVLSGVELLSDEEGFGYFHTHQFSVDAVSVASAGE